MSSRKYGDFLTLTKMQKYITLNSNRNESLISQLNKPEYKDYHIITILPGRLDEHIAYLELDEPKTPPAVLEALPSVVPEIKKGRKNAKEKS
jgi:hypothetical protein